MLTSGQCRVAAYLTDGDLLCTECAEKRLPIFEIEMDKLEEAFRAANPGDKPSWDQKCEWANTVNASIRETEEQEELRPLIQYELDSDETWQEEGVSCGTCGEELVEAQPSEEDEIEQSEEAEDHADWIESEEKREQK